MCLVTYIHASYLAVAIHHAASYQSNYCCRLKSLLQGYLGILQDGISDHFLLSFATPIICMQTVPL